MGAIPACDSTKAPCVAPAAASHEPVSLPLPQLGLPSLASRPSCHAVPPPTPNFTNATVQAVLALEQPQDQPTRDRSLVNSFLRRGELAQQLEGDRLTPDHAARIAAALGAGSPSRIEPGVARKAIGLAMQPLAGTDGEDTLAFSVIAGKLRRLETAAVVSTNEQPQRERSLVRLRSLGTGHEVPGSEAPTPGPLNASTVYRVENGAVYALNDKLEATSQGPLYRLGDHARHPAAAVALAEGDSLDEAIRGGAAMVAHPVQTLEAAATVLATNPTALAMRLWVGARHYFDHNWTYANSTTRWSAFGGAASTVAQVVMPAKVLSLAREAQVAAKGAAELSAFTPRATWFPGSWQPSFTVVGGADGTLPAMVSLKMPNVASATAVATVPLAMAATGYSGPSSAVPVAQPAAKDLPPARGAGTAAGAGGHAASVVRAYTEAGEEVGRKSAENWLHLSTERDRYLGGIRSATDSHAPHSIELVFGNDDKLCGFDILRNSDHKEVATFRVKDPPAAAELRRVAFAITDHGLKPIGELSDRYVGLGDRGGVFYHVQEQAASDLNQLVWPEKHGAFPGPKASAQGSRFNDHMAAGAEYGRQSADNWRHLYHNRDRYFSSIHANLPTAHDSALTELVFDTKGRLCGYDILRTSNRGLISAFRVADAPRASGLRTAGFTITNSGLKPADSLLMRDIGLNEPQGVFQHAAKQAVLDLEKLSWPRSYGVFSAPK